MPLRIRWYNFSLFPRPKFKLQNANEAPSSRVRDIPSSKASQPNHSLSTNTQPVLYPVHTPFNALVWGFWFDPRSVNAQEFDWFRVPALSLVDGDEMEDSVVSYAVDGESKTDGHEGRIDLE